MEAHEKWLNGWSRNGSVIVMGTSVYCAGCGALNGMTSVVIDSAYKWPKKLPDWPFNKDNCPLCEISKRNVSTYSIEEIASLGVSTLRKAMIIAKNKELT